MSGADDEWTKAYHAGCDAGEASNRGAALATCPYSDLDLREAWDMGFKEMTEPIHNHWEGFSELDRD